MSKAFDNAYRFLLMRIARSRETGTSRLPSLKTLAGQAGCSPVTMSKAAHALAREGACTIVPGGGVLCLPATMPPHDRESPRRDSGLPLSSIERAKRGILNMIAREGMRDIPVLPSSRSLARELGVGPATVQRAPRDLADKGVLRRKGDAYEVHQVTYTTPLSTIILIHSSASLDWILASSHRAHEFWLSVEKKSHRSNVRLSIEGLFQEPTLSRTCSRITSRIAGESILGYVFWVVDVDDVAQTLLAALAATGKPVSVIDETGATLHLSRSYATSRIRFFHVGTTPLCGEIVGRCLFGAGHRSIAYFHPQVADPAHEKRLAGIRSTFAEAGFHRNVHEFLPDARFRSQDADAQERYLHAFLVPFRNLYNTEPRIKTKPEGIYLQTAESDLYKYAAIREFTGCLAPLFDDALRQRSITAWVCGTDQMAIVAKSYLQHKGVRIPQDLSLIGFDDIPPAFPLDISSYNFNIPRVAEWAMDHILSPSYAAAYLRDANEIPGFVLRRGSLKSV